MTRPINRVGNIAHFGHKYGKGFGSEKRAAHPHPAFLGISPSLPPETHRETETIAKMILDSLESLLLCKKRIHTKTSHSLFGRAASSFQCFFNLSNPIWWRFTQPIRFNDVTASNEIQLKGTRIFTWTRATTNLTLLFQSNNTSQGAWVVIQS